ncbi:hypothetical protein CN138_29920 [Sinorhizobium meliloti]|uniref:hypothetical protein n=1 Tax=Rhizobium meliloti TaxID=382 RepID=UPI000FD56DB1|nr:hypothetical protein [Sinorhizobium meliloti]MDE3874593.1 hypothetical protein [Sinorhizobium meliloti]RVK16207.1 hypothetical protein CN164_04385 [Sinorhizobium meliloti]RVL44643.1 hypothetical protein CN145_30215 [Sinorhizobium meliloti]RVL64927.1 hypothetical protein CN138_29920 [Sinorhizobium meliloti]RVP50981.1 hypothetical protein CN076_32885 [Sinorhizobium meliloti]
MIINLSPQRRDDLLEVTKAGDALTINGVAFDFSVLPDGATIPAGAVPCEWLVGPVERIAGQLHLTLILPHGPSPSQAVAFPAPITNPPDGVMALPFDPPPALVSDTTEEEPANVDG